MTGRDGGAELAPIANSPVVILVRPQLADNIGACARAMANGGLFHLRLVAPRDGWPQEKAWRNASGADRILDAATVFASVTDAVADLHHVFATCPRPRHIIKPVLTARGAAVELHEIAARGLRAGVLFGPERAGLDNDDMAQADALVRYPLNPAFMSLNLAQAVMVLAYEWWTAGGRHAAARADDQRDASGDQGGVGELPHAPGRSTRRLRLSAQPAEASRHGAQHPSLLPARRSHRAGTAHPARHRHRTGDRSAADGATGRRGSLARLSDRQQALLQRRIVLGHLDRLVVLLHREIPDR